jgi:hypothetical protein
MSKVQLWFIKKHFCIHFDKFDCGCHESWHLTERNAVERLGKFDSNAVERLGKFAPVDWVGLLWDTAGTHS